MKPSTRMTTTSTSTTNRELSSSMAATSYKQAVTKMMMMIGRGGGGGGVFVGGAFGGSKGRHHHHHHHQVGLKLVPILLLAICGLVCVVSASGPNQLQKQTPPATSGRSQLTISASRPGPSQSNEPSTGAMPGNKGSPVSPAASPRDADHQMALASDELASAATTTAAAAATGQMGLANKVQLNQPHDMQSAAGHHYGKSHGGGHGKYYMYVESPKKGAYKMGYKRGNHKHMISAKASVHKSHVHAHYNWHDKKGKGSHKFEFKHYDKKGKKGHYY